MKLIILAAGRGTRMRQKTEKVPKCMIKFNNKPIINYILETAKSCNLKDISIVAGYKNQVLKNHLMSQKIKFFVNEDYENSNMVHSLFLAKSFMDDDIIISYSDIIFKKRILELLMKSKNDFSVVIDRDWEYLWKMRMENYIEDIETLRYKDQQITEIGNRPKKLEEVKGQYIGLIKISKNIINKIIKFYLSLDRDKIYNKNNFMNMYMTTFIQNIIENCEGVKISPIFINRGWIEIDSNQDIDRYKKNKIKF